MQSVKKIMKKQEAKHQFREIAIIVALWLFAIAMIYLVYLKIRMFYH